MCMGGSYDKIEATKKPRFTYILEYIIIVFTIECGVLSKI